MSHWSKTAAERLADPDALEMNLLARWWEQKSHHVPPRTHLIKWQWLDNPNRAVKKYKFCFTVPHFEKFNNEWKLPRTRETVKLSWLWKHWWPDPTFGNIMKIHSAEHWWLAKSVFYVAIKYVYLHSWTESFTLVVDCDAWLISDLNLDRKRGNWRIV